MEYTALVIEPEQKLRNRIQALLSEQGVTVSLPSSSADVPKAVEKFSGDLVVVDVDPANRSLQKSLLKVSSRSARGPKIIAFGNAEIAVPGIEFLLKPVEFVRLREQVQEVVGRKSVASHVMPELHDRRTGRLSAREIAKYLHLPLSALAGTLKKEAKTLHKTPHAESVQEGLFPIVTIISILSRLFRDQSDVRLWLNSPHPDLGNASPMSFIKDGRAFVVRDMLQAAMEGEIS